jgi:uncharacterized membrane protein
VVLQPVEPVKLQGPRVEASKNQPELDHAVVQENTNTINGTIKVIQNFMLENINLKLEDIRPEFKSQKDKNPNQGRTPVIQEAPSGPRVKELEEQVQALK